MEVKTGYKQSVTGVIPNEWDVKPLGDAVDFLDGRRRPVKDCDRAKMRGDIPYYGASGIVDYVNAFLFDEELILLGEDGENILSRNCRLAFKIKGKTWVNNHAHVLKPKPGMLLDYLAEFLESRDYAQYNTGTAQPKLNKLVCTGIPVVCPPPSEQRAIAGALSDVDALIGAVDRLIAKKRDLKQAAMQQLLTGKTRLPGFHGVWSSSKLPDVSWFQEGPGLRDWQFTCTGMKVINVTNLEGGILNLERTDRHISLAEFKRTYQHFAVDAGDIVMASSGNSYSKTAVVRERDLPLVMNTSVIRFKPKERFAYKFLWAFLTSPQFKSQVDLMITGGAQPNFGPYHLKRVNVPVPPLPEQTAIAEVLTDMDAELAALEQRRAKTRALKQGMMQELLTGRTRLVAQKK